MSCGCRPCDKWCETARALRDDMEDATAMHRLSAQGSKAKYKTEYAKAERELRDHLRGVK